VNVSNGFRPEAAFDGEMLFQVFDFKYTFGHGVLSLCSEQMGIIRQL
jgi:hypothetical protein